MGGPSSKDEAQELLLQIRLLGPMQVFAGDREVVDRLSRRGMWLLAVLALREGKPIERQRLAGMLWPDSSDAAALHNLRQTLAGLRRVLGSAADCIEPVSPRSLKLSNQVQIDALEFDQACREGSPAALQRAVGLYREPLLSGCDEPFAISARDQREQAYLEASDRLAKHYVSLSEYSSAAGVLRRALMIDPYRETTCRALMRALDSAGQGPAAMEAFRELRLKLRDELRTEPEAESKSLYREIRSRPAQPGRPSVIRDSRLPAPLSPLIGRSEEIRELSTLIDRCRLVTLTGIGGIGKTRLAIAAARAVEDRYLDGAWFVDLTPLQLPETIGPAIAAALHIQAETNRQLVKTIASWVSAREALIVLDNCEHVAEGAARLLETLLSAAPRLHVLATSRQTLGVPGEQVWRVPSLSTPEPSEGQPSESLLKSEAMRLFLDRSPRHKDSGRPSSSSLEVIGSICRKLDGIPLAIELAAARTNVLTETEIESRIEDRFALLSGGNWTNPRHKSLQAAMEWSWEMLPVDEQDLLMRLSVFHGGCTLQAVEAVATGISGAPALGLVGSLVDRSLIGSHVGEESTRFTILETIRQFSEERLQETGGYEEAADAHRDYFLKWAELSRERLEEARRTLEGSQEKRTFDLFEVEHDNLRAALTWSHRRGQAEQAMRLALALTRFWDTHGHVREGRGQVEAALTLGESVGVPRDMAATGYICAGWMATAQRDCIAARSHYGHAISLYRELGAAQGIAKALICLGLAEFFAGEYAEARRVYREALDLSRSLGNQEMNAALLSNLAEVELATNDCDAARALFEESIVEAGGAKNANLEQRGQTLCGLSLTDLLQNRLPEAKVHAAGALSIFRESGLHVDIPDALNQIAIVDSVHRDWSRAARLLGAAEALAASQGVPLAVLFARARERAAAEAREAMGPAAFEAAYFAGRAMSLNEAISLALSQNSSSSIPARAGVDDE